LCAYALVNLTPPVRRQNKQVEAFQSDSSASVDLNVALMLDDGELGKDLESSCHFRVEVYPHVKAAFAINKADDPLRIEFQRNPPLLGVVSRKGYAFGEGGQDS
jgi:hypothetical protein